MSNTNENPFLNPKKKKKHLWGLWIPLMVIAGIIVVPAALAMALFFDTTHYDTGVKEAIEAQTLVNELKGGLFDNCRDNNVDPSIDIAVTEENLNKLFYGVAANINNNISANLPQQVAGFLNPKVEQMDVQITDSNYIFEIEASALNFFKTHAQVVLKVTADATLPSGEKGFIFDLIDVRVGRLSGIFEAASSLMEMSGQDIGKILESIEQIHWKYDKANTCLYYSNNNMKQDLLSMAGMNEGLFSDLFDTFFTQNLISFPHTKGKINGKILLNTFLKNDKFYSDTLTISEKETVGTGESAQEKLMLNVKADHIETLLNGGILTEQMVTSIDPSFKLDEACLAVHKFLAFGIDFVSGTNAQTLINQLYANDTFKTIMGNKTIEQYSADRRASYFGASNTGFVDKIKEDAQAKITNMVNTAADADKDSLESVDLNEIIRRIVNGEPLPEGVDRDALKTAALFRGIQGKIRDSKDQAWYVYGGNRTTYYFDNSLTDWTKVYANAYNSATGEYEANDPGIRMTYVGDDIWSYDVMPGYDKITFSDGSHSTTLSLDSSARYYDGYDWDNVPETIVETPNDIKVTDANIHDLVKDNTGIIGFGFPFVSKQADGSYKYSYTMVDNIYPVTYVEEDGSYFALVFGLNINGTETQLVLPCQSDTFVPEDEYTFGAKFSIEKATMYYGNVEVPNVKQTLSKLMKDSSMSSSFFQIDSEAKSMTFKIDLSSLVSEGKFKTMHDELTASEESELHPYAANAKLFVNIIPVMNSASERATQGIGGFSIEVGYCAK